MVVVKSELQPEDRTYIHISCKRCHHCLSTINNQNGRNRKQGGTNWNDWKNVAVNIYILFYFIEVKTCLAALSSF